MAASAAAAVRLRNRLGRGTPPVALIAAAGVLGAAGAGASYFSSPLVGPAVCVAVALIAVTLARPEIGIAAWFPMVPLGLVGVRIGPQWLLASIWALFLFSLSAVRRVDEERWTTQPVASANDRVRRLGERLPPLAPALLVLFAITLLEALLDVHLSTALKAIRTMVSGTLVFFAITSFVRNRAQLLWVLGGIALSAGLVGALALNEYRTGGTTYGFFGPAGELVGRATAGFGQPNQLGGFLAILIPLAIASMVLVGRGKLLYLLAAVLALAGVYVSYSRGALLAVAVIPFVFLGLRRSLIIIPVALIALFNLVPSVLKERFSTLTESGGDLASRLDIWRAAEKIWSAHPITGVGPGGFPQAYSEANIPGKAFLPSTIFQPPPHAHNLFLNLLAEQGLLGLIAFLALLVLAVVGLARSRRSAERWIRIMATALLAMIAVFLLHNMFDVTLIEGTGQYVWALFGMCSALIAIQARSAQPPGEAAPHARTAAPLGGGCASGS